MGFHFSDGWILNVCTLSPTTIPQITQLSFAPKRMVPGLRWPALKPSLTIISPRMGSTRLTNSVDPMVSAKKSKKWWHRMFFGLIDRTLVNAFIAFRQMTREQQLSLLNYLR
ncbi:hypothetical protein RRG08_061981 [Elysia crispata]|uniref:PiggyBac transposable element-derived protein domain-containing protein n=1 Tax=Elysia crispata TaxID=231223 RepID=A0AAE1DS67_9GAST|nr:hypothetical protein RRG08_061981 [Elysia crispata]